MSQSAEIAIIGGGVYGTSIAFHLAKLGKRDVVLLDKGPIGAETSSQGAGFLALVRETEPLTRLGMYSMQFYANFENETGCPLALHMVGSVKIAHTAARITELKQEYTIAQRVGVLVHELSVSELRKLVPVLDCTGIQAAIHVPFEGYVERTAQVARGFANGAQRLGVSVLSHTPVRRVSRTSNGDFVLYTPRGEIRAQVLVLAAGAVSHLVARDLGVTVPTYPVQHNCVIVATREVIPSDMPNLRLPDKHVYIRHDDGGLMIGGVEAALVSPGIDATLTDLELVQVKPNRRVLVDLIAEAQTVIPAARESFVVKEQRGLPMLTPDLDLVLGDVPNALGLYVATGCCMRGVQTAPGVGRLLAELIVHNKSWVDASAWRVDRFGDQFKDMAVLRQASMRALSLGFLESR